MGLPRVITGLAVALLLIPPSGWSLAQEQAPADDACSPGAFEAARHTFHRAWFEQADAEMRAFLEGCNDHALAHAYAAIIDMLLYRDITTNVEQAERLGETMPTPDSLLLQALINFAQGNHVQTEALLRPYTDARPDDHYAAHVLGFTLNDLGRPADGVAVLEALLDAAPDYNPARNHLAYGLLALDKRDAAVRAVDAFVEADSENPSAWDTRAHVLHSVGRSEEAIASLTRSVLLDGRFAYAYRHLGDILSATGDTLAAEAAYREAIDAAEVYGPAFSDSVAQRLRGQ